MNDPAPPREPSDREPLDPARLEPLSSVLRRVAPALVLTWLAVLGTFALPQLPRDGAVAELAYWVSFSGKELLALVAAAAVALIVLRPGTSGARRAREGAQAFACVLLFVGGGAAVNEFALKRVLRVPRPYVVELSRSGALGTTPEGFYELGDREARRAHLRAMFAAGRGPALSPRVREHWITETGFSFPSGHSFAAFCLLAFCLLLGEGLPLGVRGRALWLLGPWAVAVCYSRPLLGVHSPTDVSVGAALGLVFGAGAALCARRLGYSVTGSNSAGR
ncbi:MAG: phosphatase PAP2 family protein [Planctomycetota bacterium]